MYANSSQFVKQILSLDAPKRQYKRKEAGPDDEKTRVRITLLEYGNKSLIGPSFGITAVKKSENEVDIEDELVAEVSEFLSLMVFSFAIYSQICRPAELKLNFHQNFNRQVSSMISGIFYLLKLFGFTVH